MATRNWSCGTEKQHTRGLAIALSILLVVLSSPVSLCQSAQAGATDDKDEGKVNFSIEPVTNSPSNPKTATKQQLPASQQEQKLTPKQVAALFEKLSRLPAIDNKAPRLILPSDSITKPSSTQTQIEAFPPLATREKPTAASIASSGQPLTVSRISHSGAVDDLHQLTLTFSQPLIELSTVGQTKVVDPEQFVTITPQPKGSWQWAGTQTLIFTPEGGRFPKATNYVVSVPASAKSITGNQIDKSYVYHINLPAVKIAEFYPPETARENQSPLLVAHFNQNIDQEKVLAKTHLLVGKRSYAIKAVSKQEYKSRLEAMRKARQAGEKLPENGQSWLATASILQLPNETDNDFVVFEAVNVLPKNSTIKVIFDKNLPSEEGPLTSLADQEMTFKTYGPLALNTTSIVFESSSWVNDLTKSNSFPERKTFEFNNLIDSKKFNPNMVTITPPLEEFKTHSHFRTRPEASITIEGRFKPYTRYTVTFDEKLTDIFGQKLGKREHAKLQSRGLIPLVSQLKGFKTLSPDEPLIHSVWAQGAAKLRASIRKVQADDWEKYNGNYRTSDIKVGTLVDTLDFDLGPLGKKIDINLKPYIEGRYGHLLLTFKLIKPDHAEGEPNCWIQVTDISLDSFTRGKLHVLASNLSDGKPLEGVELSIVGTGEKTKSDESGLASMSIPKSAFLWIALVGKKGSDSCVVTVINWDKFSEATGNSQFIQYAASDRQLYRPGERVYVKGILRDRKYPDNGAAALSYPILKSLTYTLQQYGSGELLKGKCQIDEKGSFSFDFVLPTKMQLGDARLHFLSIPESKEPIREVGEAIELKVEEFRRPEFETSITSSKGNSIFLGEETILTSNNRYYSGGTLANAANQWIVNARARSFSPPGWDGYKFDNLNSQKNYYGWQRSTHETKTLSVKTDSNGRGAVKLASNFGKEPTTIAFECESTVTDINRQNWTGKLNLIAHPSEIYIGIKRIGLAKAGAESQWNVVATNIDGKILPGTKVDLTFIESDSAGEKAPIRQNITIGDRPTPLFFKTQPDCKSALLSATVRDSKGRINQCCAEELWLRYTITDGLYLNAPRGEVSITSDKTSYSLGERAQLTIQSKNFPAHGLLILSKDKSLAAMPLTLEGPEKTIELPITENYYPNVVITAFLANSKSKYEIGEHTILVPPLTKTLALKVEPNATTAAPGNETTLTVELKEQKEPVKNGQVAIAVVDESVLALANYKWPDPMEKFYPKASGHIYSVHSRTQEPGMCIMVANSRLIAGRGGESGGMPPVVTGTIELEEARGEGDSFAKPTLGFRKDLAALAFFKPVVTTDGDGKAQVKFKLPDSVTRYRIMAIAAAGTDKFGSSESSLTTKLPLMIKPSAPRFLNFGDSCELSVIIQNQTDKPLKTEVALRSNNAEISEPGKQVEIPANDRVEVRFAVKAKSYGQATFQCVAKTDSLSDSTEFSLPIMTPASKESFATYGVIDKEPVVQKLAAPSNVIESIGGLNISTSSSALQSLDDCFNYLRNYQYDCSEQVSSRLIAMVSMQDALLAFGALKPDETGKYKRRIEDDIALLEKRQNGSGGFGLWTAEESTKWPYVSLQVTQALLQAKTKLYPVNERVLKQALAHLKEIEKFIPAEYSTSARLALQARALNIRHLAHDDDSKAAKELLIEATGDDFDEQPIDKIKSSMPLETAAWLLPVLKTNQSYSKEIAFLRKVINSQISETASTASANDGGYGDWNYSLFCSPRRVDATVTTALIEDQPDNPLIPKLVKGLLASRRNGVWQGTQENSYVLQTLDKYFSTYEKQTPDFEGQTWLNDTLIANHKFAGRSLDTKSTTVPMEYLLSKSKSSNDVLINKEGPGRMYYRVGLDYASKDLNLKPIDQGFTVSRTYEPVNSDSNANSDVTKDEKGTWHFKAGSTIRVKVQFAAPGARYHVALSDPLPAGTEAINKSLAGTKSIEPAREVSDRNSDEQYQEHWYEHENLRDHQAEAFAAVLNAGKYQYSYLIRATTPGRFIVPPTKAEEMYMSETFGRAHTDNVVIE